MPGKIPTAARERPPGGLHNLALGNRDPITSSPAWRPIGEIVDEIVENIARRLP
jgi:hypothetical protein